MRDLIGMIYDNPKQFVGDVIVATLLFGLFFVSVAILSCLV